MLVEVDRIVGRAERTEVVRGPDDLLDLVHHASTDAALLPLGMHAHAFDVSGTQRGSAVHEASLDHRGVADDEILVAGHDVHAAERMVPVLVGHLAGEHEVEEIARSDERLRVEIGSVGDLEDDSPLFGLGRHGVDPNIGSMSDVASRYRRVAGRMTEVVEAVPASAWSRPSPCAGWSARDVVRHMIDWMPALLEAGAGVRVPQGPSVDDDPVEAWRLMSDGVQSLLDDPNMVSAEFVHERAGRHSLGDAIGMFILGDVLIHTWDLARAAGLDEALDSDEVHRMLVAAVPMEEAIRTSGHYGPRLEPAGGSSEQDRLLAFLGRRT